jgi:hypothetical protein
MQAQARAEGGDLDTVQSGKPPLSGSGRCGIIARMPIRLIRLAANMEPLGTLVAPGHNGKKESADY